MGPLYVALNSLFILAQVVVLGFVVLIPDIDLIKCIKSCGPDMLQIIIQSSAIVRVSR